VTNGGCHCGMVLAATRKHNASNPEGFAIRFYMGHDLRHDALDFAQGNIIVDCVTKYVTFL